MSMIQLGLRNGVAEAMKVAQSERVLGEKSLVPMGQLFFCVDLLTRKQPSHLISDPAEYLPVRATNLHTQPLGLPFLGVRDTCIFWQKYDLE
jgi:hypothetical protein